MSDRSDRYGPPQSILFPNPTGRLAYIEMMEAGLLVGAVWITEHQASRPRAGIVLTTIDGSDRFQTELGMRSLNDSRNSDIDANRWLDEIAADYSTGINGLAAGERGTTLSIDALRSILRDQ